LSRIRSPPTTGWSQGSYYETYNIELDETTCRIKFLSDGLAALCSQHDGHDTLSSHDLDVSMSYHKTMGSWNEENPHSLNAATGA
jgi:hypothetical protein